MILRLRLFFGFQAKADFRTSSRPRRFDRRVIPKRHAEIVPRNGVGVVRSRRRRDGATRGERERERARRERRRLTPRASRPHVVARLASRASRARCSNARAGFEGGASHVVGPSRALERASARREEEDAFPTAVAWSRDGRACVAYDAAARAFERWDEGEDDADARDGAWGATSGERAYCFVVDARGETVTVERAGRADDDARFAHGRARGVVSELR